MSLPEIFADGIGSVQVIGATVRIDLVSADPAGRKGVAPRARIIVPAEAVPRLIDVLVRTQHHLDTERRQTADRKPGDPAKASPSSDRSR